MRIQTRLPSSITWGWMARLMLPSPAGQRRDLADGLPSGHHDWLGRWHLGESRKAGERQLVYLVHNSFPKNDPRYVPRQAHWLLSDETLDLQRLSHSRHIDRMGHGLADLVVSSP